jgi:uncharacterized C2H2 Zn-finger protein
LNNNNDNSIKNNNERFEYIPITEPVFKNGKKLRSPCLVIDNRGLYPPFIKDADNFLYCNYDKCDNFFPTEKSVYAHHSRKHNKNNNPNQIRKLIKQEKQKLELESKIRILQLTEQTTKQIPITLYATATIPT